MTFKAFTLHGEDRQSRWLVTCDHATNTVPEQISDGDLGLPAEDMGRHIAYDPGAAGVSVALADVLGCAAILSNFSRLVIDPNRGEDDPTLLMRLYDGTIIPGNRHAEAAELERRKELCYRPYHAAVGRLAAQREDTVIVSIHSFTRQLRGRHPRPWQIGILHSHLDSRLSVPFIARLRRDGHLTVGDNEPYGGHLPGDSIDRHAIQHGRQNTLIELRQDLIETAQQQRDWANFLARELQDTLTEIES